MELSQLWLWLKRLVIFLQVALEVAVGKVLMTLFPERVKQNILAMGQKTGMARNPRFTPDNWVPTFFSTQYFWFVLKVRWQRLEDKAEFGGLAPNCTVVRLSGQKCNIWDFIQGQLRGSEQGAGWGGEVGWKAPSFLSSLQMLLCSFLTSGELFQVLSLGLVSPQGSYHKPCALAFQSLDIGSSPLPGEILLSLQSDFPRLPFLCAK